MLGENEGCLGLVQRHRGEQKHYGKALEHNDALALSRSWGGESELNPVRFILGAAGQVRTPGADPARCAWTEASGGYRMECALPLAEFGMPPPPTLAFVNVTVEDRDGPDKPVKKLGSNPPRRDED